MKNYRITVNGTAYDVAVEELGDIEQSQAPAKDAAPVPKKAPTKAAPKKPAKKAAPAGSAGSVKISSPMPGKILDVKVAPGAAVSRGQVVVILEAMKMENEIVAPQDGTIATVNVQAGASVEAGDTLASMN